jgi:hypothetical protein
MNYLNSQQLAFILDIKKEDARVKMVNAWCRSKGIPNKLERDGTGKIDKVTDNYPLGMPVDVLAKELNLPTLQDSVDDIVKNFLVRPASKKWILCDYPEKLIEKWSKSGDPKTLSIPAALKSLLSKESREFIKEEWKKRFPKYRVANG